MQVIFTTFGDAMKNDIQKSAASVFKAIDNKLKLPEGAAK